MGIDKKSTDIRGGVIFMAERRNLKKKNKFKAPPPLLTPPPATNNDWSLIPHCPLIQQVLIGGGRAWIPKSWGGATRLHSKGVQFILSQPTIDSCIYSIWLSVGVQQLLFWSKYSWRVSNCANGHPTSLARNSILNHTLKIHITRVCIWDKSSISNELR